MKRLLLNLIYKLHQKIFNNEISSGEKAFLKNVGLVLLATLFAKGLLFMVQTIGGRVLGPAIYGKVNLIISIGTILCLPIIIFSGGNALTKFYQEEESQVKKTELLSTITISYFVIFIFSGIILFLIKGLLSIVFKVEISTIILSIFYALLVALSSYSDNFLKTLLKFKELSTIQIISHSVLFITFVYLYFTGRGIYLILLPLFSIHIISFFLTTKYIIPKIKITFNQKVFNKISQYNQFIIFASVSGIVLANVDKIMLNYFYGTESVGMYQASFLASTIIIATITGVFINVLFPTITQFKEKGSAFKKINKLLLFSTPLAFMVLLPITYIIVVKIYDYPFLINSWIIFCLASTLLSINMVYMSLLTATSLRKTKNYFYGMILQTASNILFNVILIPKYYITGAVLATLLSTSLGIVYFYYALKKKN